MDEVEKAFGIVAFDEPEARPAARQDFDTHAVTAGQFQCRRDPVKELMRL